MVVIKALQSNRATRNNKRSTIEQSYVAHVVKVVYGDTFDVFIPRKNETVRVRLQGVDTPEMSTEAG